MMYFDYCASSPIYPQVIQKMHEIMADCYGNPSSIHQAGSSARKVLQQSRRTLATLLGVNDQSIYFTSGGSESNNWAIKCTCRKGCKSHILLSAVEHDSILRSAEAMKKQGVEVSYVFPDKDGIIHIEDIEANLRPDTSLISIQSANNETGVIQDIDSIADLANSKHICFHCDAVQSFTHVRQNLNKADLLTLSAHKLGGPQGIGCLVAQYPFLPKPLIDGGGQESGLRSGTENIAGIAGFALAAKLSAEALPIECERLLTLRNRLSDGIQQLCPQAVINGSASPRLPGVLNCCLPNISAEEMVVRLDLKGICVSPGSACASRDSSPSHVLLAMGLSPKEAGESIRISMGHLTTSESVDNMLNAISDILKSKHR